MQPWHLLLWAPCLQQLPLPASCTFLSLRSESSGNLGNSCQERVWRPALDRLLGARILCPEAGSIFFPS